MLLKDFYELIDSELQIEIDKGEDINFKKYKQEEQRKSYAFLVWFLKFYGQTLFVKEYITDGDGDSSCDIIFNKKDSFGKEIYYVIQSKWNNKKNCGEMFSSQELKQTVNDFETILRGHRGVTKNERFNQKYSELQRHLEDNKQVKFIFLSLCLNNPSCIDNILSFNRSYEPNVCLEIVDINTIRRHFIEKNYKGLSISGPIDSFHNPEESIITLPIERFGNKTNRDIIDFPSDSDNKRAYIFILRPKTIYDLFERYNLNLFYKNVRNPLISSSYNKVIKETLEKRPGAFWYFNNGITAITKLVPDIGVKANKVELTGLQIINGAQTVYSIYLAYKNANTIQREIMDTDARITMRLIRSSDEKFNLEITRYTNSQNTVRPLDFMSNDDVQVRLQNESFNTSIWYQRRRGEFLRDSLPSNVRIFNSFQCATAYLTFHLQNPYLALEKKDMMFMSRLEDSNGLYEEIYNERTTYEDIHASTIILNLVTAEYRSEEIDKKNGMFAVKRLITYIVTSLIKVYLELYLKEKYNSEVNISLYINKSFQLDDPNIERYQLIRRISDLCHERITSNSTFYDNLLQKVFESNDFYVVLDNEIREKGITKEMMEFIEGKVIDDPYIRIPVLGDQNVIEGEVAAAIEEE